MSPPTLSFSAAKNSQSDPVLVFLIKIKLLKIGAFINLGPVLVRESPAPISPIPRTPRGRGRHIFNELWPSVGGDELSEQKKKRVVSPC